jgi:4-amino-4-deoxy-L-arabinose transferase-like glycosyltransferase
MLDSRLVISRARSWLEPRLDRVGFLIAALYALPSLGYVFGRDQAAFQYIGREWLRGSLPFRDMFEIKPPGVYAVHAISILLFGQRQWGIRILELAAILAMSWMLARSLRISGSRRGVAGILAILLAGSYYTLFDYWDSAQAEVWEATALVGAWLVAERVERPARRAALSGMLSACAFVIKFPACLLGLAIGARVVERAWRED